MTLPVSHSPETRVSDRAAVPFLLVTIHVRLASRVSRELPDVRVMNFTAS